MTPTFATAATLFGSWLKDVETGEPPVRFMVPPPFAPLDLRPSRLLLFGGAPGGGKTAAILQIVFDLLRGNVGVKALIANVEMHPQCLLERVAARLAGVPLTAITDRTLTAEQLARVRTAVGALEPVANRVAFLDHPYSLEHVAAAGTAFEANVLALDYIQRFTVGADGRDRREQLDTAATTCRRFCDAGALVLAAAAVARQKGHTGSNYSGLNLASFRGSSELEYGADACYLFAPGAGFDKERGGPVMLECGKNRYGVPADIPTHFDTTTQTFRPAPSGLEGLTLPLPPLARREQEPTHAPADADGGEQAARRGSPTRRRSPPRVRGTAPTPQEGEGGSAPPE